MHSRVSHPCRRRWTREYSLSVSIDAGGFWSFPTDLPLDGSGDGDHTVLLQATDGAGNRSGSASVTITVDTLPPGAATNPFGRLNTPISTFDVIFDEPVVGPVADPASYTLERDDATTVAIASVSSVDSSTVRINLAAALSDGDYQLTIDSRVTDQAGNALIEPVFPFAIDTVLPTVATSLDGTLNASISSFDVVYSEEVSATALDPSRYTLTAGNTQIALGAIVQVDPTTVHVNLASSLPNNSYQLAISPSVTDLAGNALTGTRDFAFEVAQAVHITGFSPANAEESVSLTRATVVRFDDAVVPETVDAESFYLTAQGRRVPGRIQVSATERFATFYHADPLPASTQVQVVVDGTGIMGRNGLALDADGDGTPGGMATASFRTLPLTRIPGTDVFGFVYDAYFKNPDGSNIPIVGATIRVDGLPEADAVTDETGRFELHDLPAPDFFVHIDGTTATNAPAGFGFPSVGKAFPSVPGHSVQLTKNGRPFDVFLPPLALGDFEPLSPTADTAVGFGPAGLAEVAAILPDVDPSVFRRVQVVFPAHSAVDESGTPATQGIIIPVPPDRLPGPLPSNLSPRLVISIQTPGATTFDVPAPVMFPNLEGLAPGEQALFFSFNHDAGRWEEIGTGTVTDDGLMVASDPGVGIRAPGWHFVQVSTRADGRVQPPDEPGVRVRGRLGDLIRVDLKESGGQNFRLNLDSFVNGKVAGTVAADGFTILGTEGRFSSTGVFYVRQMSPAIPCRPPPLRSIPPTGRSSGRSLRFSTAKGFRPARSGSMSARATLHWP